jgi:hypothetical protein
LGGGHLVYLGDTNLRTELEEVQQGSIISREYKEEKLREITDAAIEMSRNDKKLGYKYLHIAIQAIGEHNKMSGSYAPIRTENLCLSADGDIKELVELRDRLLIEKKKEY